MENKEKSLLDQNYGIMVFGGMCLFNPFAALVLYGYYRFFKWIGSLIINLINKVIQLCLK